MQMFLAALFGSTPRGSGPPAIQARASRYAGYMTPASLPTTVTARAGFFLVGSGGNCANIIVAYWACGQQLQPAVRRYGPSIAVFGSVLL